MEKNSKKKLSEDEIDQIKRMMSSYRDLHYRLTLSENKIEVLNKTKIELGEQVKNIKQSIDDLRDIEKKMSSMLFEKYGTTEINFDTFEIVQK